MVAMHARGLSCFAFWLCFRAFCFALMQVLCSSTGSHSSHPFWFDCSMIWVGQYLGVHWFISVMVPGGCCSQGCHGYWHACLALRNLPQAHLLAMRLMEHYLNHDLKVLPIQHHYRHYSPALWKGTRFPLRMEKEVSSIAKNFKQGLSQRLNLQHSCASMMNCPLKVWCLPQNYPTQ